MGGVRHQGRDLLRLDHRFIEHRGLGGCHRPLWLGLVCLFLGVALLRLRWLRRGWGWCSGRCACLGIVVLVRIGFLLRFPLHGLRALRHGTRGAGLFFPGLGFLRRDFLRLGFAGRGRDRRGRRRLLFGPAIPDQAGRICQACNQEKRATTGVISAQLHRNRAGNMLLIPGRHLPPADQSVAIHGGDPGPQGAAHSDVGSLREDGHREGRDRQQPRASGLHQDLQEGSELGIAQHREPHLLRLLVAHLSIHQRHPRLPDQGTVGAWGPAHSHGISRS